jgi:ABC-type transporter Mla maintaining outer membrane lipid asymmetry ATPase subunit MlaF
MNTGISSGGQDAVVRISGLSQRYKSVVALDAVTLDLPPGQIVGLLGPDGVGIDAARPDRRGKGHARRYP